MLVRKTALLAVSLAVSFLVAGCGSDKPLIPVSGQITYGGGEWPMAGTITLTPISVPEGGVSRPGSSNFGVDGKFEIGSYKPGDGIRPGTYKVIVSCYDHVKAAGKPESAGSFVPSDFTPNDLIVEPGQDAITLNFDVPKKK